MSRKNIPYTTESFKKKLKELKRNDIELVGEYVNAHTKIEFKCTKNKKHKTWFASPTNILSGCGCPECKKESISNKLSLSHEDFIKKHKNDFNKNIEIIGKYIRNTIPILVQCKTNPNHKWMMFPDDLVGGRGCPFCRGMRVDDTNSVASCRPDLVKYFKDKDDALKYTSGSSKRVDLICPNCGFEKNITVQCLTEKGFSCPVCGDGISYPNKFIRNMLSMLGMEFNVEWTHEKCKGCYYDVEFKINNEIYLVEMDGDFHYFERGYGNLKDVQEKDKIKNLMAKENGWNLIRIEALQSSAEYLFNNIKNSELSKIFDLSNFDYVECGKRSEKSLVIEVCEYFNKNLNINYSELGRIFKLNSETISNYIKKGKEYGLINKAFVKKNGSKLISVYKNGKLKKTYISATECVNNIEKDFNLKISKDKIYKIIKENKIIENKYTFKYVESLQDISPDFYK